MNKNKLIVIVVSVCFVFVCYKILKVGLPLFFSKVKILEAPYKVDVVDCPNIKGKVYYLDKKDASSLFLIVSDNKIKNEGYFLYVEEKKAGFALSRFIYEANNKYAVIERFLLDGPADCWISVDMNISDKQMDIYVNQNSIVEGDSINDVRANLVLFKKRVVLTKSN